LLASNTVTRNLQPENASKTTLGSDAILRP
jgi:hypothetical protein